MILDHLAPINRLDAFSRLRARGVLTSEVMRNRGSARKLTEIYKVVSKLAHAGALRDAEQIERAYLGDVEYWIDRSNGMADSWGAYAYRWLETRERIMKRYAYRRD